MTIEEFERKWRKKYDKSKLIGRNFFELYFHELFKDIEEVILENFSQWQKEYYKNFVNIKDVNIDDTDN